MAANVDASRALDELEAVLYEGREPSRCQEAMEILRRWQWDRDLDDASRHRAAGLVHEFGRRYAFGFERRMGARGPRLYGNG
jgi:hypothetical protein